MCIEMEATITVLETVLVAFIYILFYLFFIFYVDKFPELKIGAYKRVSINKC